ncbi:MAG TPA: sulfotransferase [Ideonella sp.]|uniref:sulfotransferase n=1 Tax=Ideonella sp. TaxID=1929293 RepID=UPI002E3352BA|nr:sulfotransferase [Ideonella sp.]HEX5686284.1 sulfotransferase [Ideonella sp.]
MRPRQVAIFGCPRSGTSWLGQLFNASEAVAYRYQPLFSYEFKNWFGVHGVSAASLDTFNDALLGASSDFVLQSLRPPKVLPATHLVWKEVRYHQLMPALAALPGLHRLIYIHRPAPDVINSWYQAPKEFRAGQDIHAEYLHAPSKNTDPCEYNGYAKWKESLALALAVKATYPDKVLIVSYEKLRSDPMAQLSRLFAAVGLPMSQQVLDFIAASTSQHEDDAYSVFRTQTAALTLPADIVRDLSEDAEGLDLASRAEAMSL